MKFLDYLIEVRFDKLLIGRSSDSLVKEPVQELELTLEGVKGDRHSGFDRRSGGREKTLYPTGTSIRNNRQWSALSKQELETIAGKLDVPEIKPEWLGANFVLSGIRDVTQLPSMSHLILHAGTPQQVVLIVYNQNGPCRFPGEIIANQYQRPELESKFPQIATGCRGIVGWVEKGGVVKQGDSAIIRFPSFIPQSAVNDLV